jgi:hypothetical protein
VGAGLAANIENVNVISNECERSPESMEISPFGRNDILIFAAEAAPVYTLVFLCVSAVNKPPFPAGITL